MGDDHSPGGGTGGAEVSGGGRTEHLRTHHLGPVCRWHSSLLLSPDVQADGTLPSLDGAPGLTHGVGRDRAPSTSGSYLSVTKSRPLAVQKEHRKDGDERCDG